MRVLLKLRGESWRHRPQARGANESVERVGSTNPIGRAQRLFQIARSVENPERLPSHPNLSLDGLPALGGEGHEHEENPDHGTSSSCAAGT